MDSLFPLGRLNRDSNHGFQNVPKYYPICVGHEIIGTVIRVGSKVTHVKAGDRVGVGAQADSCQNRPGLRPSAASYPSEDCAECAAGQDSYCARAVATYGSLHFTGDKAYGGYGRYHRCPGRFAIPVPELLESVHAASMLCAGITVYSPLRRWGVGPGKKVGVVGLGGLGHFAVLFANALGADRVVAISRRANKREDALKLGADTYIATAEDESWVGENRSTLDLVLCTVSSNDMPLNSYISLLKTGGTLVQLGIPHDGPLCVDSWGLIAGRKNVTGSLIGSPGEIAEMFELAVAKGIKPWVEKRSMKNANQAIVDMVDGKARYRYVLVNDQEPPQERPSL